MKKAKVLTNVGYQNYQRVHQQRIVSATLLKYLGTVLLFLFLLPYIITALFHNVENSTEADQKAMARILDEDFSATDLYVELITAAGRERIPVDIYLVDKLSRSIDKGYETETLKAQAILLRTALAEQLWSSTGSIRGGIMVRDEEYGLGEADEAFAEAVYVTRGVILTYRDEPAKAPFFAVSNGMTRDGREALGTTEYPYLKSAACGKDFMAEKFISEKTMAKSEFIAAWEKATGRTSGNDLDVNAFTVTKDSSDYIIHISYPSPNGQEEKALRRPAKAEATAEELRLSGEECRTIWGLDSACFEIEEERHQIKFTVKGAGHGLGMSQFAANEMAKTESDYVEILEYFFPDTQLTKFE